VFSVCFPFIAVSEVCFGMRRRSVLIKKHFIAGSMDVENVDGWCEDA
jgi:hypothetical protein